MVGAAKRSLLSKTLAALALIASVIAIGAWDTTPPVQAKDYPDLEQQLKLSGADALHRQGITGKGVKIGIIDSDFFAYKRMLGGALPANLITKSFHPDGIEGETEEIQGHILGGGHGTAVAEIVHGMAPDAQLYLVNIDSLEGDFETGNFRDAVDYLIGEQVDIITMSLGHHASGPGDGTGPINDSVNRAIDAGILWVNVSGNEADSHWRGAWKDDRGNGTQDFADGKERLELRLVPQRTATVMLRWDEPWQGACSDFQVAIYSSVGNSLETVSRQRQDCSSNSHPVEILRFRPQSRTPYYLTITRLSGSGAPNLDLFVQAAVGPISMQYSVPENSLRIPGDNERALVVGAVDPDQPNAIESYSSRGTTVDGRTKPDIVTPDGISTWTAVIAETEILDPFYGTSASAPVVAGAAALVAQLHPDWNGEQLKAAIMNAAFDLGERGRDNTFGAGRLDLRAFWPEAGVR